MTSPQSVFNYCPRCGDNRFRFDGSRSFCCEKCQFHFYVNSSAAVAAIIIDKEGKILFTVRAFEPHKGMLDLPGGFVDPLETAEGALVREIKEELGLDVRTWQYIGSASNEYLFSGLSVYTTDLCFSVEVVGVDDIKVADDVVGYEFISPSDIDFTRIGAGSIVNLVKMYIGKSLNR